jgi:hypothetical protein
MGKKHRRKKEKERSMNLCAQWERNIEEKRKKKEA